MINDQLVTWFADVFRDPTRGVNVHLPSVPRPAGEAAPPAVKVLDVYTDDEAASGKLSDARLDDGPFLVVGPSDSASFAGLVFDGSTDSSDLAVMYADGRSDTGAALQDAHRTLRTVRRVAALRFAELGEAALDLGGCTIDAPTSVRVFTTEGKMGAAQIMAVAFFPFPSVDRWALGAPA